MPTRREVLNWLQLNPQRGRLARPGSAPSPGSPASTSPTGWPLTGSGLSLTPPPNSPTVGCRRRRGHLSTSWGSFSRTATSVGSSVKCFWSSARRRPGTRAA